MNTVELLHYALRNAFGILSQVTGDLTQEQADWTPPGVANPIGATYWHAVSGVDEVVHGWGRGEAPLHQREGWRERVLTGSPPEPERGGDYLAYYRAIRIDLAALNDYAQAVTEAAQGWLASLTPEDLERQVETPIGELSLAQLVETFVIWHINAHCGEISALKGCQGAKGYPF
ncbi:MAG TPA: DinB family protein [Chloroflexi bacterium]|nr:DinB family protein [Chloroflexota bacterium]